MTEGPTVSWRETHRWPVLFWIALGGCLWGINLTLSGAVYSPRVVPSHQADVHSLRTFAQFEGWRDLEGDAKVYRIFEYLTDRQTGLYPMGVPAWEGAETLSEYGAVRDPIKMLNVYPIGHCGTLGPTAAGIMEGMGVGPARTLIIPGWHHVAAEVFYGDRWHYLDLDVRAAFRRGNGTLASMAEAQKDPSLWQQSSGPRFFPLDDVKRVQSIYSETSVDHRYGFHSGGHTMDLVLRQGETFTRWWQPQEGRWNHHSSYAAKPFPRQLLEKEPVGPKSKHPSFTIHSHGNGRFIYRPDLTWHSTDAADGFYYAHNVKPGPDGLTLTKRGQGYAFLEVRSPYVIVPRVGDLDRTSDDREASVVRIDAVGAKLAISSDNGLTWLDLGPIKPETDLTSRVAGTYGYLLRITLQGEAEQAVLRQLAITTWVQVHPASLPALRRGTNRVRFLTKDHFGQSTRVVEVRPDMANREAFLRHLVAPPKDYDPTRKTGRIRGSFIVKVRAPRETRIAWFSAGASFATHQGAAASKTSNTIAYALEGLQDFHEIYRAAVPTDQSHWHYNVDREIRLPQPARDLFVRYVGNPAVNNVRIYAHCLEDSLRETGPIQIRHVWTEDGKRLTHHVTMETPGSYEVVVKGDPVNESVELHAPSKFVPPLARLR